MKKYLLVLLLTGSAILGLAQSKYKKLNTIGISLPIIWNNSEATYYSLGNARYVSGKAISYGVNLNHSRTIYKSIVGVAGIGYFKQVFGLKRPFDFIAPDATRPFVFTESYQYNNIHLFIGLGYRLPINKRFFINGIATYNNYISFRQKYKQSFIPNYSQVNNKVMTIGHMVNLHIEPEVQLSKKTALAMGLLLPVSTRWKNDRTFIKNDNFNDAQQIARNKFSIGTTLSYKYHF